MWDDFKSSGGNGYVVEYKLEKSGKFKDKGWSTLEVHTNFLWTRIRSMFF